MAKKPVGEMVVSLDLESAAYTKAQQRILAESKEAAKTLNGNLNRLGVTSDELYAGMANKAELAFRKIGLSAKSSLAEVERSYAAMVASVNTTNQKMAANPLFETLGIRSTAAINAQKAAVIASYEAIKTTGNHTAQDLVNIERAKNTKLKELNKEMVGDHEMSMASMTRAVLRFYAAYYVISTVVGVVGRAFMDGVATIDKMKLSAVTVAATITNLQGTSGNVVENYKKNLEYAQALVPVLMKIDAASLANLEQVMLINNAMAMHGVILDGSNKKQLESAIALTNAIAMYTVGQNKEQQATQETNALLNGEVTVRNRIALMIDQMIKRQGDYKDGLKGLNVEAAKHNDWLERINPYLVGIAAAAGDISKTWEAVSSSLKTTWMILQTEIFADFYKGLVTGGQEAIGWARENASEIGKYFKIAMGAVGDAIGAVWGVLKGFGPLLVDLAILIAPIAYGFGAVLAALKPIGEAIGNAIAQTYLLGKAIVSTALAASRLVALDFEGAKLYWNEAKKGYSEVGALQKKNFNLITTGVADSLVAYDNQYKAAKKAASAGYVPKVTPGKDTEAAKKSADELEKLLEKMKETMAEFALSGLDGSRKAFEQNRLEAEKLRKEFEKLPEAQKKVMYAEIEANQVRKDTLIITNMVQKSREENARAMEKEAKAQEHALQTYQKIEAENEDLAMTAHERAMNRIAAKLEKEKSAIEEAVTLEVKSRVEADKLIAKITAISLQQRFEQENANEKKILNMKLSYLKDMGKEYTKEYRDIAILKIKNEANALEKEFQNAAGGSGQTQAQQDQLKAEQDLTLNLLTEWEERLKAYATYLKGMGDTAGASKALAAAEDMAKKKIELQDKVTKNAVDAQQNIFDKTAWTNKKIQDLDAETAHGYLSNIDNMISAAMTMYDKDSSEYAQLAEWKKGIQIAQLAVEAAQNVAKIAGFFAVQTAASGAAVANAGAAVTGAAIGVGPTGFATAAAMIALLAGVFAMYGIAAGGGSVSAATPALPKSTVLGAADGTASESISNSFKLMEDTYEMTDTKLTKIYNALRDLNNNITGLVASIFRAGGFTTEGISLSSTPDLGTATFAGLKNTLTGLGGAVVDLLRRLSPVFGILETAKNFMNAIFGGGTRDFVQTNGIEIGQTIIKNILDGAKIAAQKYTVVGTEHEAGWWGKNWVTEETVYSQLDQNVTDMLTLVFSNLGNTLFELARGLGTDTQAVLDYVFETTQLDLKDMDAEEMSKVLTDYFNNIADKAAEDLFGTIIKDYRKVSEAFLETAARLVTDKAIVEEVLKMTGQTFTGSTANVIAFSEALIELAGDLETLTDAASTYYDKFFTDAEKQADLASTLGDMFSVNEIIATVPATREAYRSLVEGMDLTTDAGMKAYWALLQMSESADAYYSYLEEVASKKLDLEIQIMELTGDAAGALAAQREIELAALDESLRPLQLRIYALQDEAQAITDVTASIDTLKNRAQQIAQFIIDMGMSTQAPVQSAAAWDTEYARQKTLAMASGATDQQISSYLAYAKEYLSYQQSYGTAGSYQEIYDAIMKDVTGLGTATNTALDIAQKQLDVLIQIRDGNSITAIHQGFADGGISTGSLSGYEAKLHGTELIVSPRTGYPATVKGKDNVIYLEVKVPVNMDGREIGNVVARQISRNGDLRESIDKRVKAVG